MLGTEYNWLISTSSLADGTPRVRMASPGLLTMAVAVFCFLCVSLRAEPNEFVSFQGVTLSATPAPRTVTPSDAQID